MTGRTLKINAETAVVSFHLAGSHAAWIGAVRESALLDTGEDLVELLLGHEERVMLHLDLHVFGIEEVERHLVGDLDAQKGSKRYRSGEPKEAREELRR